jgi:hypothetical protein
MGEAGFEKGSAIPFPLTLKGCQSSALQFSSSYLSNAKILTENIFGIIIFFFF